MMADDRLSSRLLAIPPEIREHIYRLILDPKANRTELPNEYFQYDYKPALVLFQISKQIYFESRKVFRDLNNFVRVETPWPEAQKHVSNEGHVPMVAVGRYANKFSGHRMTVGIDAPEVGMMEGDEQRFLILLEDLEKFTEMWFYSNLTHPGLNPNLRLTLTLRDPFTPAWEEKRVPKALQRRLILPFGGIRDLQSVRLNGDPKPLPSIESELKEMQVKPLASPEHCLRECARLKFEGNAELSAGKYTKALAIYKQAWKAIHVIIKSRSRHIFADRFFTRELREEPYTGKNGQSERLILRVSLVANTCQAYLKMEDYDSCAFWGMRSIKMLRDAMGADERHDIPAEDEAVVGFPGAVQSTLR